MSVELGYTFVFIKNIDKMNKRITKKMKMITMVVVLACASFAMHAAELVGTGQYYPTLKSAFDDINAGNLTGAIELQITSNTTSPTDAILNAAGAGFASYSTIKIYPTSPGLIVNENIVLLGADNLTIDGRVNQLGSARDMTITGKNATGTILLTLGANNNKFQYLHLITGNAWAVLFGNDFYDGNHFNKISNCLLEHANRNMVKVALIESTQYDNGVYNHHDSLINNEFKNFFCYDQVAYPPYTKAAAIWIKHLNYAWHIEGNSFYDEGFTQNTNTRCSPAAIRISAPALVNFQASKIVGNYIGGSQANCGGAPLSATSNTIAELQLVGIDAESGNDSLIIKDNVITNIALNNNKSINGPLYSHEITFGFIGISCHNGNIVVRNNTIGSTNLNSQIVNNVTNGADTMAGIIMGTTSAINVNTLVESNTIGGLTSTATANNVCSIFGIYRRVGSGYAQIINNTIGSISNPDNIHAESTTTGTQNVRGVIITAGDSCKIWNNTISHMTNMSTNAAITTISGIWVVSGVKNFNQWNAVLNLKGNGTLPYPTGNSIVGIIATGTSNSKCNNNRVENISNINTGALNLSAIGISVVNIDTLSKNYVSNISTNSTGPGSTAIGITGFIPSIHNNIVNMGTTSRRAYGLSETGLRMLYNTIIINGDNSNYESAAYVSGTSNNYVIKNNILINNKQNSSGTSSRHFAIIQNHAISSPDCNYNDYYVFNPTNGGAIAKVNFVEYIDYPTYAALFPSIQNQNSLSLDPQFVNINSNVPSGFVPLNTALLAVNLPNIIDDYFSNNRSGGFIMGALQSSTPLPLTWKSFEATKENYGTLLRWITSSELNTSYFEVEKSTDTKSWKKIATVTAAGNTETEESYTAKDEETVYGMNYYRIKSVDMDGQFTYSSVEQVFVEQSNHISIYPNPVMNTLYIKLNTNAENTLIEIYSLDGKKQISENASQAKHTINVEHLQKGTYMIRISTKETTYTSKFVRQ